LLEQDGSGAGGNRRLQGVAKTSCHNREFFCRRFRFLAAPHVGCARRGNEGLDVEKDSVIELAMVKAEYTLDGTICRVIDTFSELQEPADALPAEITRLTGITDAMVRGRAINPEAVSAFVDGSALIVAHHAAFDRAYAESRWPVFEHMPWACSATQVDWKGLGFENARLTALLAGMGFFYPAHRASDDCHAMLHLLAHRPNGGPQTALSLLLDAARRKSRRVYAIHAPYPLKEQLKRRKYRWNDGSDGRPKAWFIDVDEGSADSEADFLRSEIYGYDADIEFENITAFTRFSRRRESAR
jgi:DNA polymerase-3 subunit epsilon